MSKFAHLLTGVTLITCLLLPGWLSPACAQETAVASLAFTQNGSRMTVELTGFTVVPVNKAHALHGYKDTERLALIVKDDADTPLDTIYIPYPLVTRYEYPDDKLIRSAEIPENRNDILIHFPYLPSMSSIDVIELGANRTSTLVAQIKLPKSGQ